MTLTGAAISELATLVAFDTTSRLSNLELIAYLEARLGPLGFRLTRLPDPGMAKANLLASIGPDLSGGLVLSGHTDVVPVDGQDWSSDPFTLRAGEGRLYGRGTADMKGFLACVLALAPTLEAARLARPLHLAFSYDEEVGCKGVPGLIAHMGARVPRPRLAVIGEPTSMRLVNANKGIVAVRTEITGHEAHSSQTHRGLSAIGIAAELMGFLAGIAEEMRGRGDPSGRFEPPYTTLNIGQIEGGTATNIIARHCTLCWEYRPLPGTDEDEIFRRFSERAAAIEAREKDRFPMARIAVTRGHRVPGLTPLEGSDAESLAMRALGTNHAAAVSYAAEAGLFQQAGIPSVICGPGDIAQAHKTDEYVEEDQLAACLAFLDALCTDLYA